MPEDTAKRYKARFYAVTLTLSAAKALLIGESTEGSFNVVNLPFTATRITSAVVGPTNNALEAFTGAFDGSYSLEFRTDQHNYQGEPLLAAALHGLPSGGYHALPAPIEMAPKTTCSLRLVNQAVRTAETKFQVIFHGVEPIVASAGIPT